MAAMAGLMCLVLLGQSLLYRESMEKETCETLSQNRETVRKVAITFDDDVIIGLSQEISYKEAVSMI